MSTCARYATHGHLSGTVLQCTVLCFDTHGAICKRCGGRVQRQVFFDMLRGLICTAWQCTTTSRYACHMHEYLWPSGVWMYHNTED
eukprot:360101-Chlamydomonas_euryale.AAC.8